MGHPIKTSRYNLTTFHYHFLDGKVTLSLNIFFYLVQLRKAAKALFLNDDFTEEEKHNYFMSVTEREVINGCINAKNVKVH